jgi:hypothetical protein
MDERVQAQRFANQLLDEAYADPDDDYRVLARQFNRQFELIAMLVHAAGGRVAITKSHMISFDRKSTLETWHDVASDNHILQLHAPSAGGVDVYNQQHGTRLPDLGEHLES